MDISLANAGSLWGFTSATNGWSWCFLFNDHFGVYTPNQTHPNGEFLSTHHNPIIYPWFYQFLSAHQEPWLNCSTVIDSPTWRWNNGGCLIFLRHKQLGWSWVFLRYPQSKTAQQLRPWRLQAEACKNHADFCWISSRIWCHFDQPKHWPAKSRSSLAYRNQHKNFGI